MSASGKTKAQLAEELGRLQDRVQCLEQALAASEEAAESAQAGERSLAELLKYSRDIVYRLDLRSRTYAYLSSTLAAQVGFRPEELLAMGFDGMMARMHPEDLPRFRAHVEGHLRAGPPGGDPTAIEYRWRCRDGSYKWFSDSGAVIWDEDGSPVAVLGSVRDITERKEEQRRLAEREAMFLAVFNCSPLPVTAVDTEGRVVLWNAAAERLFGWPQDEVLGRFCPVVPPEMMSRFWVRFGEIIRDRGGPAALVHCITRDGTPLEVDLSPAPLEGVDGELIGIVGLMQDVTERRRADRALRESEARYRALVEDMPALVCRFWADGTLAFVNDAYCEYFQKGRDDLVGQNFFQFIPEDHRAAVREHYGSLTADSPVVSYQHPAVTPDGTTRYQQWTDRVLCGSDGRAVEYQSIGIDITERELATEALRKSEEQFRLLVENVFDGVNICEFDPANVRRRLLFCNERYVEMSGYTVEQLRTAEDLNTLVIEHHSPEERLQDYYCIVNGIPFRGTNSWKRPDGKPNTYEWSAVAVKSGGKYHIIGIDRDITERRDAEERSRESREQLRALAARLQSVREEERASIAREIHDELGHALAPLRMDLSWLGRRVSEEMGSENKERIREKLGAMTGTVDDMIGLIRRIATELRPGVLDDLGLAAAIEWQVREFHQRTGIGCDFVCPREEFELDRDRATALFRICQEVLTNVARHAHATRVRIELLELQRWVRLRVVDNGRGITEEEKRSPGALGILGIRERALAFGGTVRIEGTPGRGTAYTVSIPVPRRRNRSRQDEASTP